MPIISKRTYHGYLKKYIKPKIEKHHQTQTSIVRNRVIEANNAIVHLGGDCQYDSPGYSVSNMKIV
jgi:hypothetical protein